MQYPKLIIEFIDNTSATKALYENLKTLGIPTQREMQTNDCAYATCILISVGLSATAPVLIACINAIAKIKVANIENTRVKITLPDGTSTEAPNRKQAIEIIDKFNQGLTDQD